MPGEATHRRTKAPRVLIGRVADIRVFAHATCLFGGGLLALAAATYLHAGLTPEAFGSWLGPALAVMLFYPSVLAHEFAHAAVALRRGVKTSAITLHAFGASSETRQETQRAGDELAIAAAGPAMSVALGLAGASLHRVIGSARPWSSLTGGLAVLNFGIALLNLFPVFPSDGTRIIGALLWPVGDAAQRHARVGNWSERIGLSSLVLALLSVLWGRPLQAALLLLLCGWLALGAHRAQRAARSAVDARPRTVGDAMATPVVSIPASSSLVEVERQFLSALPYRIFPVLRGERVVGILRRQDVLRQPVGERDRLTAQAVMIRLHPYLMASPADELEGALSRLNNRAGCVVVVEEGRLRGLLTWSALGRQAALT